MLQRIRDVLQVTSIRVTTYQEHLASYLQKMLQRSRNVLQVSCVCTGTWTLLPHPTGSWSWKSSAVPVSAGQQEKWWGCCAPPHPTAPHPTPPVTDHERAVQCLCLQDSKKDDEVAVPVCAQEHENYYATPPHPTGNKSWKSSAVPVSAGQQERWWGCCACVCTGTWPLLPHPTPPYPAGTWMRDDQGAQVSDILLVGAQVSEIWVRK